jgi:eukaryotic-like serine/threonine-protein kinase
MRPNSLTAGVLVVESRIVGAYEIGALLGAGTVGEVYRARHRDTGAPAVVKFLQANIAGDPEVQRRFVREVAIAERLDHPNIVRHYDCGLHEDQIYFAMELVDCGTLKDVLSRRDKLPWREAAECAIQICAALEHAHQRGVIHRDLKPANLFLSGEGRVKVGDFGLARDLNRSRLTLEGQTVGTCRYMPPEQITGEAELTGTADLYALGCILYQALAGRPPFDGDTIIDIFEAHLYSDPTPLAQLAPDCPAHLSELIQRLLAKDPTYRPASAAEVQAALAGILHDGRLPRTPAATTAVPQLVPDPAKSLTTRLYNPAVGPQPAATMRRPWLWFVAALVAALAVMLLTFYALV